MPYHKNPQQAFQAAEHGMKEVKDRYQVVQSVTDSAALGRELAHLKNEVSEAYQQIDYALVVATDKQKEQLRQFQSDLQEVVSEMNVLDEEI